MTENSSAVDRKSELEIRKYGGPDWARRATDKPRFPAEMQEQPDRDLGVTQAVQELLSMRIQPEQPRELSVGTRVSL